MVQKFRCQGKKCIYPAKYVITINQGSRFIYLCYECDNDGSWIDYIHEDWLLCHSDCEDNCGDDDDRGICTNPRTEKYKGRCLCGSSFNDRGHSNSIRPLDIELCDYCKFECKEEIPHLERKPIKKQNQCRLKSEDLQVGKIIVENDPADGLAYFCRIVEVTPEIVNLDKLEQTYSELLIYNSVTKPTDKVDKLWPCDKNYVLSYFEPYDPDLEYKTRKWAVKVGDIMEKKNIKNTERHYFRVVYKSYSNVHLEELDAKLNKDNNKELLYVKDDDFFRDYFRFQCETDSLIVDDNIKVEDLQVGTIIMYSGWRKKYGTYYIIVYVAKEHIVIDLLKENDARFVSRCEEWSRDFAESRLVRGRSDASRCTHRWKKRNACTDFKLDDPYGRISIEI